MSDELTWDAKIKARASGWADSVDEAMAFDEGAHWMLKQLRTDESVERVAEAIYRSHDSYTHFSTKLWAEMVKSKDRANKFRVKQDRNAARAAMDALLGDD